MSYLRPWLLPVLLILCGSLPAISQPSNFSGKVQPATVCLPAATLARVRDTVQTLRTQLPLARQEAASWQRSSNHFEQAHLRDSTATVREQEVGASLQRAWQGEHKLRISDRAELSQFRHKAHKRGLLNWLLAGALALATSFALTH